MLASGNLAFRSYITDIHSKAANLEQRVAAGGAPSHDGGGGADQFQFQSVKGYLEGIKHDVEQIRTNQRTQVRIFIVNEIFRLVSNDRTLPGRAVPNRRQQLP